MQRSSVAVDRQTVLDLNQIKLDMGRREAQSVPLGEVVRRLVASWYEQGGVMPQSDIERLTSGEVTR